MGHGRTHALGLGALDGDINQDLRTLAGNPKQPAKANYNFELEGSFF